MEKRSHRLITLFLVFVALESPAMAYLDGATGSILLQAAIGLVAGGMVYYRMYTARAKAFFARITGRASSPSDEG